MKSNSDPNAHSAEAGPSTSIPSPTESFAEYLPSITFALDTLTTAANGLPSTKSDISFHRTMDRRFANDLDEASSRVLSMTERLLAMVDAGQLEKKGKGKEKDLVKGAPKAADKTRRKLEEEEDVIDGYKRGVLGVVDGLLEDSDSCLDELSGQRKKAAIPIPAHKLAAAGTKMPGPFNQGKSFAKLPYNILHNAKLSKPQLLFPDTIDNANDSRVWRPTLQNKDHSMVPLDFVPPLEYELTAEEAAEPGLAEARKLREMKLAQHPYYYETRHLPYPTSMFTITEPREPASFEDTPYTWVDTPEALEAMVAKLQQANEIAVDLEHHSLRTYYGITCLMQISDRNEDWVVDTLALRGELREKKLGGVMTDPAIIKVFHGADSDILWLQRDFDIYIVNLFDTFHASKVLDFTQHSLAYLLSHYCQFEADKRYQLADWRARPLPEAMAHYARSDTHFLLYVYDRLRNALLEESSRPPSPVEGASEVGMTVQRRNPQEAMRLVLERSGDVALRLYEREAYDDVNGKGNSGWTHSARKILPPSAIKDETGAVFKALHIWRDAVARTEDEAPHFIFPADVIKMLSTRLFSNALQVEGSLLTRSPIAARYSKDIFAIITEARQAFWSSPISTSNSILGDVSGIVPGPSTASSVPTSTTANIAQDIWDDFTSTAVPERSATSAAAPKSSLFGSTISSKAKSTSRAGTSTGFVRPKSKNSALFGSTISARSSKAASPTYDEVMNSIFQDLVPVKQSTLVATPDKAAEVRAAILKPLAIASSQLQSVPGQDAFDQTAIPTEPDSSEVHEPSPPKRPKTEEIVQVKKSSKSSSKPIATPAELSSSTSTSSELPGHNWGLVKPTIKSKKRTAEVPEFDYSQAPNLLDNPKSGIRDQDKKKKKKEKKERKEFSGDFGPAPKEKSNMRAGNKSGTF